MPEQKEESPWMQAAATTGQGIVGTAMGLLTGGIENKRQRKQQRKLNEIQFEAHKRFSEFNQQQELKMWEKTGPKEQMRRLKEAGLNTALMYDTGGGAGGTTQTAAGGEAAPQATRSRDAMDGMGMALQSGMMQAQIRLMEAQTKKTEAEAENTGVNTEVERIIKDIRSLERDFAGESYKARVYMVKNQADKALQELEILKNEGIISANTWSIEIEKAQVELLAMQLENDLKEANKTKTAEEIKAIAAKVAQEWRSLDQTDEKNAIERYKAETGEMGVIGGLAGEAAGKLFALFKKAPKNISNVKNQVLKFKKK